MCKIKFYIKKYFNVLEKYQNNHANIVGFQLKINV